MGAWATPSGDWGGISRSTMKSGRTRRWGIKRRAGCTEAGERRRPHGRQGDFAPAERRGARTAAGSRRECPPAGTAKEGWAKKRGLGLSLFLPAGSRGKTRWIEETQSYSLNWPKFCLDIGEHLRAGPRSKRGKEIPPDGGGETEWTKRPLGVSRFLGCLSLPRLGANSSRPTCLLRGSFDVGP